MQKHRDSFIQETDFVFLKTNGINTVRIPIGWWIASDPNPPAPFVSGSLQALDNAFQWAKYVWCFHYFFPRFYSVALFEGELEYFQELW
jgi:aryl-phospho-beta-D-glucosidase BglC (GH1 family)